MILEKLAPFLRLYRVMKHLNIRVEGKVQGVFFRDSTQSQARKLGTNGFVQNEPDGTVYAEAEGEEAVLDSFLSWIKEGPSSASVDDVSVEEGELEHFSTFEVRA